MLVSLKRILFVSTFLTLYLTVSAQNIRELDDFSNSIDELDFDQALYYLDNSDKSIEEGKEKLLYYMNKGAILSMQDKWQESNAMLEEAYYLIEDFHVNAGEVALSYLTNPLAATYQGENAEKLVVHYYKAYNFLRLGQPQKALVEAKRMDIRLNEINDMFKNENKYQRDAFIHLLMGLVYDANREFNDAFTAYRNAYEIYKEDYQPLFGMQVPEQLKFDLIRSAENSYLYEEAKEYREKFQIDYDISSQKETGDVVVFWNNGKGPVKRESNFTFSMIGDSNGGFVFADSESGEQFPSAVAASAAVVNILVGGSTIIKMAYPYYEELGEKYHNGRLRYGTYSSDFELAEDVNAVLMQSIADRKSKEISEMLGRYVVKQLAKEGVKKGLGYLPGGDLLSSASEIAMDAANVITEKADVRNWRSLPHSIYYSRMSLPVGERQVNFSATSANGEKISQTITTQVREGSISFAGVNSLDWYEIYQEPTPAYNQQSMAAPVAAITNPTPAKPQLSDDQIAEELSAFSDTKLKSDGSDEVLVSMDMFGKEVDFFRYFTPANLTHKFPLPVGLKVDFDEKNFKSNLYVLKKDKNEVFQKILIEDLSQTAFKDLNTTNTDYQLNVSISQAKIKNRLAIYWVTWPFMLLGVPLYLPIADIAMDVQLIDNNGQVLLSKQYHSRHKNTASLYNFNKKGNAMKVKDKHKGIDDPFERAMKEMLSQFKADLVDIKLGKIAQK